MHKNENNDGWAYSSTETDKKRGRYFVDHVENGVISWIRK